MARAGRVREFYAQIEHLERLMGGRRRLLDADAQRPWPHRGVFFLFERGERRSGGGARVVHVGTHALTAGSGSTLWSCLRRHRGNVSPPGGNHRASRLRRMVGEAIMAKKPELAVDSWGRNEKGAAGSNRSEVRVERLVSRRVRDTSVVCLAVEDAPGPDSLRAFIARNAIALLSGFVETSPDPPSPHWLGRHSPRERVRGSGLWNDGDVDAEVDSKFLEIMAGLVLDARSLASRPTTHPPKGPGASQRRMLPRRARHGTRR